jgi:hypothetical protein
MKMIDKMTREELETEIVLNEKGLYEMFDEKKLINKEYTLEELVEITTEWIIEGNEATCK